MKNPARLYFCVVVIASVTACASAQESRMTGSEHWFETVVKRGW